jgi:hypothetical protein
VKSRWQGELAARAADCKVVEEASPAVLERLEELIDPATPGDPMSPLRWTAKSTRHLAQALSRSGHAVSHQTVAQLLKVLGYSLQGTMKTLVLLC